MVMIDKSYSTIVILIELVHEHCDIRIGINFHLGSNQAISLPLSSKHWWEKKKRFGIVHGQSPFQAKTVSLKHSNKTHTKLITGFNPSQSHDDIYPLNFFLQNVFGTNLLKFYTDKVLCN